MTLPEIGDKAPDILGATAAGRFYSLDAQAGRAAVLVALGARQETARRVFDQIRAARAGLAAQGVDVVPLAPTDASLAAAFAADPEARDQIVYVVRAGGLETAELDGRPAAVFIDRGGRVADLLALDDQTDLVERLGGRVGLQPPRKCASAAPVLIIPGVAPPALRSALIAHFEASPHTAGVMASYANGGAQAKFDETQKHRRDIELTADSPLYGEVLDVLARRCVPEIKRAFQVDIACTDRILIARYDDTGGYFKRHRDNALPHTEFREFAVSLNLNTQDYEGGELSFPEYSDDLFSPPAGAAAVFSASLLHEAGAVTKGRRYVLLSFLCSAAAQARMAQASA
jgi:predicted 2-oxoglutarate/Fe(II)-dependent dioxygenase YbiX